MSEEVAQHREAYRALLAGFPEAEFISHYEVDTPDWSEFDVYFPTEGAGCKVCGDPVFGRGLTVKCRDLHEVCRCGARYDEPKADGCRRRKHPKPPMKEK